MFELRYQRLHKQAIKNKKLTSAIALDISEVAFQRENRNGKDSFFICYHR